MNFSLESLRASLVSSSPLISSRAKFLCKSVFASKFAFSFMYSPLYLSLSNSRFENFLHTSLLLTSAYSGLYTSRPTQPSSGDVEISDALFIGCCSSTTGGAIYQSGGALTVKRTTFITCYCTTNVYGGALEAEGSSATITSCCGNGCYTNEGGQFVRAVITSTSSSIVFNYTSSTRCAPTQITNSLESIISANGYNNYYYCNASFNKVILAKSSFATDSSVQSILMFCTIGSNQGTVCIRLYQSTQTLGWSNIFNNTGHENGAGELIQMLGTSTISNCVFMENGDYIFGGGGSASVYNCAFSNSAPSSAGVSLFSCSTGVSSVTTTKLPELYTFMCRNSANQTKPFSYAQGNSLRLEYLGVLSLLIVLIEQ